MVDLSKDQKKALSVLIDWFKHKKKGSYITLGGFAGTGKTMLISLLRKKLHKEDKNARIAFCTYTGKASRVLSQYLNKNKSVYEEDFVGTIHSLIYSPIENDKKEIIGWQLKEDVIYDSIIIDEASMVDESIWKDLLSYHIPIIAVGDHGQLPPINGSFNLMEKPMLRLEEIHRQVKNNPIIQLSFLARMEGKIPEKTYAPHVMKLTRKDEDSREFIDNLLQKYTNNTFILCGYNTTRKKLNSYIRASLGFDTPFPQVNDRVICLRNNRIEKIFNGMLGTIKSISEENENWYFASIRMDHEKKNYKGLISRQQFSNPLSMNFTSERFKIMEGDLFDFGYALTVHKAQGSQAQRVILFEERFKQMTDDMWRRWLYTGVTRAEKELYIIG